MNWVEAADNPWNVRLLDLRETALGLVSTTSDPRIAATFNAMCSTDGSQYVDHPPLQPETPTSLKFRTAGPLPEGILFSPREMEDKWALFFYGGRIICARSWTGEVSAIGLTRQEGDQLIVYAVQGGLKLEPLEAAFDFLIRAHALNLVYPAPLQEPVTEETPTFYFSLFGQRAQFASAQRPATKTELPLRTITPLHLASVRGDEPAMSSLLQAGIPITVPGPQGATPLHWAVAGDQAGAVQLLLARGCPVDAPDEKNCTPLMTGVQSRNQPLCRLLLENHASAGHADARGFTSLHRAAEMGETELVELLLTAGAAPHPEAEEGHTPLSLATRGGHIAIVARLQRA